jgi:AmmeMemoRadiSam system protein A
MSAEAPALCDIAVDAIAAALREGVRRAPAVEGLDPALAEHGASFVTLERGAQLLGCVGSLEATQPLALDVAEHACAAAFDDPRVPPITHDDFEKMSVKVSVLSPSEPVLADSYDAMRAQIRAGVDGVTVEYSAWRRATLLPSVWDKVRDHDEFLDVLWQKGGLRPRTWPRGIRVARYTTVETCDAGPRSRP